MKSRKVDYTKYAYDFVKYLEDYERNHLECCISPKKLKEYDNEVYTYLEELKPFSALLIDNGFTTPSKEDAVEVFNKSLFEYFIKNETVIIKLTNSVYINYNYLDLSTLFGINYNSPDKYENNKDHILTYLYETFKSYNNNFMLSHVEKMYKLRYDESYDHIDIVNNQIFKSTINKKIISYIVDIINIDGNYNNIIDISYFLDILAKRINDCITQEGTHYHFNVKPNCNIRTAINGTKLEFIKLYNIEEYNRKTSHSVLHIHKEIKSHLIYHYYSKYDNSNFECVNYFPVINKKEKLDRFHECTRAPTIYDKLKMVKSIHNSINKKDISLTKSRFNLMNKFIEKDNNFYFNFKYSPKISVYNGIFSSRRIHSSYYQYAYMHPIYCFLIPPGKEKYDYECEIRDKFNFNIINSCGPESCTVISLELNDFYNSVFDKTGKKVNVFNNVLHDERRKNK